jgi:hypothetical protein
MEDILERYERQNHTELTGATNETQVYFIELSYYYKEKQYINMLKLT